MLTTLANLPLYSRRSEHERVQTNKMNIEIRFYSRSDSYLNSTLIRHQVVMNSLFAVEHMALIHVTIIKLYNVHYGLYI